MRVALIHMKLGLKGGLETRLYNYIQFFRKRGDEVTVITSKITGEVELPKDVHIVKIDLSSVPKPIRPWMFASRLADAMPQYQFDFSLSMARSYSQQCLIAPNTHKGYLKAMNKKWLSPTDWQNNSLDKKAFKRTKHIFACSNMVRQEIIDLYGGDATKIHTLYPPVNTATFHQGSVVSTADLRTKHGLPQGKKIALFVSTSHKRKGLDLLMEAFKDSKLRDYHLAIAGSDLQNLPNNIQALGFVRNMAELYHACDLTVHPAIYEPFGQIVSESICCSTPAIVGPNVGAKEVITPNTGLVVSNYHLPDWINAIKTGFTQSFNIPEDFAQQNGLTLEQHCERMLAVWGDE